MIEKINLLSILIMPFISSLVGYFIGKYNEKYRDIYNICFVSIELILITSLYKLVAQNPISIVIPDIMGTGLYLRLDMFRYIFIWVTVFIWFLVTIYSTHYLVKYKNRNRYYSFFMLTLGSTIGIFLSENLLNLFTFFEIMSLSSYALVIHDEDEYSHEAGKTYISMAILGGLILLMGLFFLYDYTSTLNISELPEKISSLGNIKYAISYFLIIGFGIKASMFPFHAWLPKAHPAAPTPASAILSGILIKTGIFGIMVTSLILMNGDLMISASILVIGFFTMFIGGFLAVFQRNIKRILAYSSMSQSGYILVGIGLIGLLKDHSSIAVLGTMQHIINHAIFKVLLFLVAGIIYMILHELSINKIYGFGKHKFILKITFAIGLLAIIGMPGFNGFISKTLLHHALSEAHHMYHNTWLLVGEVIFTLSSSLTIVYLFKIFFAVFVENNNNYTGQYKKHIKKRAIAPLIILSSFIIYIGLNPSFTLNIINNSLTTFSLNTHSDIHLYSLSNMISFIPTFILGCILYYFIVSKYLKTKKDNTLIYINPSLNWFNIEDDFYKPVSNLLFNFFSKIFSYIDTIIINLIYFIDSVFKVIGDIEVNLDETKQFLFHEDISNLPSNSNRDIKSISDIVVQARQNLNTLVCSLFTFATTLMLLLFALLLNYY